MSELDSYSGKALSSPFQSPGFKKLLKSSLTLLLLNLTGAGFHYLYQIIAARRLDVLHYGDLNSRISSFSVIMSVGVCAQFIPVLIAPRLIKFSDIWHWAPAKNVAYISLAAPLLFFLINHFFRDIAVNSFIPLSVMLYLCVHFWLGVFQSMHRFFLMGLGGLGLAVFKLAAGFQAQTSVEFQMAIPFAGAFLLVIGLLFSLVWTAWLFLKRRGDGTVSKIFVIKSDSAFSLQSLIFPFLIGFGTVFLPIYDLFNVRYFITIPDSATALGEYSRLMLFSKILYHAPQTLLQITLPHYVSIFKGDPATREEKRLQLMKLEWLGLIAVYFLGFVFSVVGPLGAQTFLNIHSMNTLNIFLSCMAVPPLYGLLSSLQIFGAQKRAKAMTSLLLMTAFSPIFVSVLKIHDLTTYLIFSAIMNSIFGFLALRFVKNELFKA